jgi:hypothetical protein
VPHKVATVTVVPLLFKKILKKENEGIARLWETSEAEAEAPN